MSEDAPNYIFNAPDRKFKYLLDSFYEQRILQGLQEAFALGQASARCELDPEYARVLNLLDRENKA